MRILVVDDSDDARDLAEAVLLDAGYREVNSAGSAVDAFAFLAIGGATSEVPARVDLVLLDILMPEIDGIEACARIRSDPRYADVPIIMVTLLADMENLANAFVAGATDYITKPLNRVELLARVRSALKLKSELDRRLARERELLQFMSTWGDRRAAHWIDEATGLFVGEVAEAYLIASANSHPGEASSVIALAVDRLDAYRSTQGDAVAAGILAQVARVVRATVATVGVVAAAYRSGVIVVIVPEINSRPVAQRLGETLRAAVSGLVIANRESIAANHVTASVAVVTGGVDRWIDRVHLLTRAMAMVQDAATVGGNRVVAIAA
jgi:PleD family two-component response regulator